jgi:cell shape-determining protein MreC
MRIKNIFISGIVLLFVCYGLVWQPRAMVYPLISVISLVQYPFLCIHALFIAPISDTILSIKTHTEYHTIIRACQEERSRLLKEVVEVRSHLVYYKNLQDAGITCTNNTVSIGQIIYKQLHQADPFFIIDKGSADGVAVDMVAVLNNVLLGRVVAVFNGYAQVMPISNPQCHIPIVCAESRSHGVFHNSLTTHGQLDFISHLEPLVLDDLVLTSGDGLIYPQGLALGRIKKFTLNELGFLYEVDVESLYDLEKIYYCSIISKNTQQALAHVSS